jgi:hypothetical protein
VISSSAMQISSLLFQEECKSDLAFDCVSVDFCVLHFAFMHYYWRTANDVRLLEIIAYFFSTNMSIAGFF